MIKQVLRITISSDRKEEVAETQKPLPSTSFSSKFLPITLIAPTARFKATSLLNFTKFTGGGFHCSIVNTQQSYKTPGEILLTKKSILIEQNN